MTPFLRFLRGLLAQLAPLLHRQVKMRVALHRHPGVSGIIEAAMEILQAIPGIELVDLKQPAVGLQSVTVGVLPAFKRKLQLDGPGLVRIEPLNTQPRQDPRQWRCQRPLQASIDRLASGKALNVGDLALIVPIRPNRQQKLCKVHRTDVCRR
jgi:hypothetical protein